MKRFFTFTLSLLLPAMLLAQSKVVLKPAGSNGPANEVLKIRTAIDSDRSFSKITPYDHAVSGLTGTVDTLDYGETWGTNFGMFGQDYMVQWFEAPADMDINAVGFNCSDDANAAVSVKIVSMAWDIDQIQGAGVTWYGYYEATGNGYNDIGAFMDDLDVTGGWVEAGGNDWGSPFGADLWSDFGEGASATAVNGEDTWVDMSLLGFSPSVLAGDLVGVVIKNEGTTMDAGRTGLSANNALGYTGFKMYRNGRLQAGIDFGWWSRAYTWDIALGVELTGDRSPVINSATQLVTTLSTDAQTVDASITDDNPSGGAAGVASATLFYSVDSGDTLEVAMSGTEPDFTADIPGQAAGSSISYWITAVDVGELSVTNNPWGYNVFEPSSKTLLVMNGQGDGGYPTAYYFGSPSTYPYDHDTWAYGGLTDELVAFYDNIFEIATGGPTAINSDVIGPWLAADGTRDYMLAGDEWLGSQTGWVDQAWAAGSFHNDVLGITFEYNDNMVASSDISQMITVPGSFLGDKLDSLFNNVMVDSPEVGIDTLLYDPNYEITVTNWLDGVDVEADCDVFIQGVGPKGTLAAGHSRTLAAGNNIAFFAYDPLSLNSTPYYWFGYDQAAPQIQALHWMQGNDPSAIEDEFGNVAESFKLRQNYPNPFNPTTQISYFLPTAEKVSVKVFDLMGREVATLVNAKQIAGNQSVSFDATNFASGMYVYTVKAGSYNSSKKMLLVK